MGNSFVQTQGVSGLVLVWDEDGLLYRVPRPLIGRYRLSDAERVRVESELLQRGNDADSSGTSLGPDFIRSIPADILAPYQLSDEEVESLASQDEVRGHEQAEEWTAGYGPTGIVGTWCIQQLSPWTIAEMDQESDSHYDKLRDIA
jgi:hypothetical protein